jgi:hypothetical protein
MPNLKPHYSHLISKALKCYLWSQLLSHIPSLRKPPWQDYYALCVCVCVCVCVNPFQLQQNITQQVRVNPTTCKCRLIVMVDCYTDVSETLSKQWHYKEPDYDNFVTVKILTFREKLQSQARHWAVPLSNENVTSIYHCKNIMTFSTYIV